MPSHEAFPDYESLWRAVAATFNGIEDLDPRWQAKVSTTNWTRLVVGELKNDPVHYEWIVRDNCASLDVCLHFEFDSKSQSNSHLGLFAGDLERLRENESFEFAAEAFGGKSAEIRYRIPLAASLPTPDQAVEAAHLMKRLIDRTFPRLRRLWNIRE